jgi:hypothetical protein
MSKAFSDDPKEPNFKEKPLLPINLQTQKSPLPSSRSSLNFNTSESPTTSKKFPEKPFTKPLQHFIIPVIPSIPTLRSYIKKK